ncbi:hypothetical protein SHI21_09135 [Bacteriovorax sp. PP10]|uniref:SGNH/GDSL hydrolase family protein n=1 Tax=Bacteriovorax antarcticus TaxID=3088717 RepID=A0ABU5VTH8_9BACT|nr:hypothetical protein [Bacteriovorax sp. PP10]MEA9356365.1 hypothetical protein [Bacteriovorax sp. PP10]
MQYLTLLFSLLLSYVSFAQENSPSKLPIIENHSTYTVRGYTIENSFYTQQPPLPRDYGLSIEYSINTFSPFTTTRHISKVGNEVTFDVTYESAELGLRKIPAEFIPKQPSEHLIVAGDSNTFGDGVSIENTLPVLLSQKIPGTRPYNWGIRGAGPNNTLAMMEFLPWEKTIHESRGTFIYNHYDFLIERVIGFKDYIQWSEGKSPYYNLNDKGVATYQGNFNTRFLTRIFQVMNYVKWINNLFPILPRPRYQHTVILAKVYLKMFEEYKKKFPEGNFLVAINYNFHWPLPGRLEDLQTELKKNKVPFVVMPFVTDDEKYLLKDLHLNPKGHQLELDILLKVLPLNKIARQPNINSTDYDKVKNLR